MNKFDKLEAQFEAMYLETLEAIKQAQQRCENYFQGLLDIVRSDIEEYEATGIMPVGGFDSVKVAEAVASKPRGRARGATRAASIRASSVKENNSDLANQIQPQRSTRTTRLTSAKSNQPTNVVIKLERITENFSEVVTSSPDIAKKIKREALDMPPPTRPPVKRTRTRKGQVNDVLSNVDLNGVIVKQEAITHQTGAQLGRESDVLLETNPILNITIVDSDEDSIPVKAKPSRTTRTKKRRLNNVETNASEESEDVQKTKLEVPQKPNNLNATVVLSKNTLANSTFVVNKETFTEQEKQLLTDDEEVIENSVKETKGGKKKQIFNPYAGSPVKNRVAAFEKLGGSATEGNSHATRAKTKKLGENTGSEDNDSSPVKKRGAIPRLRNTPLVENHILPRTASVDCQQHTPANISKPKSTLKATQQEFRARELRRQQTEKEAIQKKEALINAQIEEKRRRNEERQLKAQQHRDALEKEKQQLLEAAENAKLNKMKQLIAEKEEKQLKLKEEANKKRQLALKKAAQEKLKEEKQKLQNKTEAPLLPTPDCYDSDDDTNKKQFEKPAWQTGPSLHTKLISQSYMDYIERKLFSCRPQYPDMKLIFPYSKPVSRNSSVIWDTSNISVLPSMIEEEED